MFAEEIAVHLLFDSDFPTHPNELAPAGLPCGAQRYPLTAASFRT